jgi:hypothetical protein
MKRNTQMKSLEHAQNSCLPGLVKEFDEAYRAFAGIFDTPAARRQFANEYADDARRRLREFSERLRATPESPDCREPVAPSGRYNSEQVAALRKLSEALTLATNTGLFDEIVGYCTSPDSINDLCDAVDGQVVRISGIRILPKAK